MNVLFVSQCSGNALVETRRILDQFAERRGERNWQTPITWEGLQTVHLLLRKTARRNTAVACFRLRRDQSELLWIVGNVRRFNERGATPTDSTTRDMVRAKDENDWRHGEIIRLLAALAALFHDFGKAMAGFQTKLRNNAKTRDPYRHEWVSVRLFAAVVGDARDDASWLARLAKSELDGGTASLVRDGIDDTKPPLQSLPPLARAVAWLILSHHRLPTRKEVPRTSELQTIESAFTADWLSPDLSANARARADCWRFPAGLPLDSRPWRERAARIALQLMQHPGEFIDNWLGNPYVMHLARLALMLSDHYVSSLPSRDGLGERGYPLFANTDASGGLSQRLDEHLLRVSHSASSIAGRALPRLAWQLPRIARHRGFRRRTGEKPFLWQNRAFDLAEGLRLRAARQGFFGVNMASTGTGKTLANGRILYALADSGHGARFTVALGLRVLTLQTGDAYRGRLGLGPEDLAVLVGGGAVRELYDHQKDDQGADVGNAPPEGLLAQEAYVHFEGGLEDGPLGRWLEKQPQALLQAPIVVCTIDHVIPATEGIRGGRQILPMLRLMSSDLVLDEVDDFDVNDLPAVTRLVHWAGMLGSRILLSSATLPPALVQGLFQAYMQGRIQYQHNRGEGTTALNICCAWFDEFECIDRDHADHEAFTQTHTEFVRRRLENLAAQPQRRRARICPVEIKTEPGNRWAVRQEICRNLAGILRDSIVELHGGNHQVDPRSGKRVSVGLVRMANIDPLVGVARQLAVFGMPEDHRLHLCVYHSRFPLYLRANIEARLDRLLERHRPGALFEDGEMRQWLSRYDEPNQVFVVMASPVAEVGRDHDYDWAVVEPSSMRSVIQLAGRLRRHRSGVYTTVNLHLLSTNFKHLERKRRPFCRPGYECGGWFLKYHDLRQVLREEEVERIDSSPRIQEHAPLNPQSYLSDLEHAVIRDMMLGDSQKCRPVTQWWGTHAHLTGLLQTKEPFRAGPPTASYRLLPDDDGHIHFYHIAPNGSELPGDTLCVFLDDQALPCGPRTVWWSETDDFTPLERLATGMALDISDCARRFATVELPAEEMRLWDYHPVLGFFRHGDD